MKSRLKTRLSFTNVKSLDPALEARSGGASRPAVLRDTIPPRAARTSEKQESAERF